MREENIRCIKCGENFKYKGSNWTVLDNNVDGGVLAIMTSYWDGDKHTFDLDNGNNYAKSTLRENLLNKLLPMLGEENLISHEVDLVANNGDDRYGKVTDKLFILSYSEYCKYSKNVPLFPTKWMWTCTPFYISDNGNGSFVYVITGTGKRKHDYAYNCNEVAPACVFNPNKLKVRVLSSRKFNVQRKLQVVEI